MRATTLVLSLAVLLVGCGAKDPLADVRERFPDADEYLTWKSYVLVRLAPDEAEPDHQPAVLLKREGKAWVELGRSERGFVSGYEVMTHIPEMDEDGVAAFGLR